VSTRHSFGLTVCLRISDFEILEGAGNVARMSLGGDLCRVLVGKPEGMRLLGRRSRRWEDNIKMDNQGVRCGVLGLIGLSQDSDRWRGTCECGNET
jgi:hypothetical protein